MVNRVDPPPEPSETLTDPRELLLAHLDWYREAALRRDVVRELADGTVGE